MVSLPLAQLLHKQNPKASNLSSKIPHPSHLTVPVVEPPNTPTFQPRPTAPHGQIVHHNTPNPLQDLHHLHCTFCFPSLLSHMQSSPLLHLVFLLLDLPCKLLFLPPLPICPFLTPPFFLLCPPQSQVSWRHKESRNTLRILMVWSEY